MNEKLQNALTELIQRISDGAFQQLPNALMEVILYTRMTTLASMAWEILAIVAIYYLWRKVLGTNYKTFKWNDLEDGQCWMVVLCVALWTLVSIFILVDIATLIRTFYPQAFALEYLRGLLR